MSGFRWLAWARHMDELQGDGPVLVTMRVDWLPERIGPGDAGASRSATPKPAGGEMGLELFSELICRPQSQRPSAGMCKRLPLGPSDYACATIHYLRYSPPPTNIGYNRHVLVRGINITPLPPGEVREPLAGPQLNLVLQYFVGDHRHPATCPLLVKL
jgi:hypothetical protein